MATKLKTVEDALNELPGDTIHIAMARAFAEIDAATKSATNPHFKSKYADLTSVIEAIKPPLVNNGLFFTQRCQPAEGGVCVETYVYHRSGENLSLGTIYVPANRQDAQGYGSAITYARRYALQTGFGVPTEDDDGNAAVRTTANPSTGEPRRRESVVLDGPYDTLPKLERAAKEFVHSLRGMSSLAEFDEWAADPEVQGFVTQCKRDLPDWWFGGPSVPSEMTPLEVEVRETKRGLKQMEMEQR